MTTNIGWDDKHPPALSSDRSTVVDKGYHWLPIWIYPPPRAAKVQLINRTRGVATYGTWAPDSEWTHWAPLPTFARDE